jgi:quinol monooxygenase YgiN
MIVELRQYTLKPGRRDELIEIFEQHLIESQEATGMTVIGQFRDLDDEDRFVWLRSFPDMAARKAALTEFYGASEAWRTHGPAANATMVDVSDARLLRPVGPVFPAAPRPPVGTDSPARTYTATITPEPASVENAVACFATEPAENDFPRLPIRTDTVFVTFRLGDGPGLRLRPTPRSAVR